MTVTRLIKHHNYSAQFCVIPRVTFLKHFNTVNVTQHIERYQLSADWILSYEMQSQNISKYSPKVNFEISHTLQSSILNL